MAGGDIDNMGVALKVVAAMIALSLLWVIFDSGSIISFADIAFMDCSSFSEYDSGESNTQNECRGTQNEALAVVLAAGFGVLICFIYILFGGRKV